MIIKMMFKHAFRWGYTKTNLAEYVNRPKVQKTEIEILNPEEIDQLLDNVEDSYRVAFLTDVMTGLRAGELWGLQWGDIDWNLKQLYVRRSLWTNKFLTPKSKYSIRTVDIPDSLIHELKKWKLACPVSEHDLVFPSSDGNLSGHGYVVRKYFNSALRRSGLRHVRFHSLRHTNASMRIQAGQNIKYISVQLGHSSIRITLDIYGHLFNDANFNRQQADLLDISFQSVRNPLEKDQENIKKDSEKIPKSLVLNVNG
jgi:integrase